MGQRDHMLYVCVFHCILNWKERHSGDKGTTRTHKRHITLR